MTELGGYYPEFADVMPSGLFLACLQFKELGGHYPEFDTFFFLMIFVWEDCTISQPAAFTHRLPVSYRLACGQICLEDIPPSIAAIGSHRTLPRGAAHDVSSKNGKKQNM